MSDVSEIPSNQPSRAPGVVVATVAVASILAVTLTPHPGALINRSINQRLDAQVQAALEKHAPHGVSSVRNEQYRFDDVDAVMDVYFPEDADRDGVVLPTICWAHGGGWISGSKDTYTPYFQLIAAAGYTVVAANYSLSPKTIYPAAVLQLNDALAYIQEHAARLHVDVNRIILVGDSAGAQLSSQIAALITNPDYASEVAITPSLDPEQLRGVVLACGVYDLHPLPEARKGIRGLGDRIKVWAYTGSRERKNNRVLKEMSTRNYVTRDFSPAFVTGGNNDSLTHSQSRPMAETLQSHGVDTTTLFYPADHSPALGHEYQFDLDTEEGQSALVEILACIKTHVY